MIPRPKINPIYFSGYPPIKATIKIIKKRMAVVEKSAGRMSIKIRPTGSQSFHRLSLNIIFVCLFFAKYLAR